MKKTLIALAVIGAVGAAHAQSSVTIYGQLNPSYDVMTVKEANGDKTKTQGMSDNSSRIGFKGTEDLGGGLKAIFQMESYFDVVTKGGFGKDDNGPGSRDAFAGFEGNWGTFRVGAYDPVYKRISASYDPFGDTIADYNSIMGVNPFTSQGGSYAGGVYDWDFNTRYDRVLGYISPVISGLQFMVDYHWEKTKEAGTVTDNDRKLDLGVTYNNGPLNVFAAYSLQKQEGAEDLKAYKIGAAYKLPTKTTIRGIAEQLKQNNVSDVKHYLIGVEHPLGNVDLLANYIHAGDDDEIGADSGAKAYNLGVRYNFSKRTNILGMYTYIKNDDNAAYGSDAGYAGASGSKVSGFSVRLQHKF